MDQDFLQQIDKNRVDATLPQSTQQLLEENLRYSKAIYEDTQKIRRYMFWRLVLGVVWLVVVLAPIIFALIYLPPIFGQMYDQYQELLTGGQGTFDLIKQLNTIK